MNGVLSAVSIATLQKPQKRVKIRTQNEAIASEIAYTFSLSPLTSRILSARGFIPDDSLKNYLVPTLRSGLPDPSSLLNLDRAVEKICDIKAKKESIAIACDFDVDGLSGGALVHDFFRKAGIKSQVYVPNRFTEGYGLNPRIIREASASGHKCLLTIDFGTTNEKELLLAKELGLTTLVVDHHHVQTLPPADVFVNPQQAGCGFAEGTLAAAGLAWYLILGLSKALEGKAELHPKEFLDLACLGTICDMVPLRGANRIIARRGLESLEGTKRPGLIALKNVCGVGSGSVSCSHVSFGIGPRLNAAGRMVSGELVIELLTTSNSGKAEKLAKRLNRLNQERQATEERVKQKALRQLSERSTTGNGLVVWDKEFHTGVIGIVAQRLVEQFYRPSAVMGFDQGHFKGSVRGIRGVSVIELLSSLSSYLVQFGGHEGAGGFSLQVDAEEEFANAFDQKCAEMLEGIEKEPSVEADTEAQLAEITPAIVRELKRFEPLGVGNPGPQLLVRGLEVRAVKVLKESHLKVTLGDGNNAISGMMWRTPEHSALRVGNRVDVVGKADLNTFFGQTELQMNLQAVEESTSK